MDPQLKLFLDAPQPMMHCKARLLVTDAYLKRVFEAGQKLSESGLLRRFIKQRRHPELWQRLCFLDACEPIISNLLTLERFLGRL